VTGELPVHVSRRELHSLDVPASFETDGHFDVVFINHDQAVHVHLRLDDTLSEVASLEANNHYVDGESRRAVRVNVDTETLRRGPVAGRLEFASGYGATTRRVDVELGSTEGDSPAVDVGESLATPPDPDSSGPDRSLPSSPETAVSVLGALALAVAVLAAVSLDATLVLVGALAVLAGVVVALLLLVRA
jgi:hypothetical protein